MHSAATLLSHTSSNSPQPNTVDVSDTVWVLDGLYINIATPVVIISTNRYFSHGYFLCASTTPRIITGIGFTDLPNTFVIQRHIWTVCIYTVSSNISHTVMLFQNKLLLLLQPAAATFDFCSTFPEYSKISHQRRPSCTPTRCQSNNATTIWLRHIARACFHSTWFDASKKWTCQFFVVVVSQSNRTHIVISIAFIVVECAVVSSYHSRTVIVI